jgi:hypothetical protein
MNRRQFFTALGLVGAIGKLAAQGAPGGAAVRTDWLARHTLPIPEGLKPGEVVLYCSPLPRP